MQLADEGVVNNDLSFEARINGAASTEDLERVVSVVIGEYINRERRRLLKVSYDEVAAEMAIVGTNTDLARAMNMAAAKWTALTKGAV